jgi:hypothetical protein
MRAGVWSYGASANWRIWELSAGRPTNWLGDKAGPAAARVLYSSRVQVLREEGGLQAAAVPEECGSPGRVKRRSSQPWRS